MKSYKDGNGTVYTYTEAQVAHGQVGYGLIEITEDEKEALVNPTPSDEDQLSADKAAVRQHYESAMESLRNGYSQAEANTFHRKTSAADAYLNSTATDMQIYYLALIDGVVDGSAITDPSTVPAAVAAIDEAGMAIVAERVQKIVIARTTFDLYSAKAEQMREEALDNLVLGADNSAVVDGLAAAYAALGA